MGKSDLLIMNKTTWRSHTTVVSLLVYLCIYLLLLSVVATMLFLLGVFLRAKLFEGSRQQLEELAVLQTRPRTPSSVLIGCVHGAGASGYAY